MDVELSVNNGVATICLNRPDSLNAITPGMLDDISGFLDKIAGDPEVRALVLTGNGRAFCAGADVKGSGKPPAPNTVANATRGFVTWQRIALKLYNLDIPVISAVRGATVGIAWTFVLCADMIIASETTKFIPAFLIRATIPEAGFVHLLAKKCGELKAKEILYLNRTLLADDALKMGLVNQVVADDELMNVTDALANELAAMPTFSIGLTKQLFRANSGSLEEFQALERNCVALAVNSEDSLEGRTAFGEKRKPNFKGR